MRDLLSDSLLTALIAVQPENDEVDKDYHAIRPLEWQCNCNSDNPCANGCRNSCKSRMR